MARACFSLRCRCALRGLALIVPAVSARGQTDGIRGTVRRADDSTIVAGVEVRIPELRLTATSDVRGEFRFSDVPAGRWLLRLRRIGFTRLDTVVVAQHEPGVALTFRLNAVPPSLDTVDVLARLPSTAMIPEFEARRTYATGRFITRDELRAMDDRNFIDVLRAHMPGLSLQRAPYGTWAYSPSQQAPKALLRKDSKPCYTQIIVDRVVVYQATDPGVDPPDISEYLTRSLDGVEYYSSPSRTPPEFRTTGAACGTLVLWTRRR